MEEGVTLVLEIEVGGDRVVNVEVCRVSVVGVGERGVVCCRELEKGIIWEMGLELVVVLVDMREL